MRGPPLLPQDPLLDGEELLLEDDDDDAGTTRLHTVYIPSTTSNMTTGG